VIDFPEMVDIVRGERIQRDWSYEKAAYLSGVPRITIFGYEKGSIATFASCDYFRYLNTLSMRPTIETDDGPAQVDNLTGIPGREYR
jgi:hypothetical protein